MTITMLPSIDTSQSKRTAWLFVPVLVIGVCLVSNVLWDVTDQKVWDWDPSAYAYSTLQLWDALSLGVWNWLNAMAHALGGTPPLMVWLAQFFIPLRYLTGEAEPALLAVNLFTAGTTLVLVYLTARRLGTSSLVATVGVLACASAPAFVGLTGRFMVEMTQCMTAAVMLYAACGVERRSVMRAISLLVIGVTLSFLSKSSSMTYVVPLLTYAVVASWISRASRLRRRPVDLVWLIAAATVSAALIIWYAIHWDGVVQHFVGSTTSDTALYWGTPVILATKLSYWLRTLQLAISGIPGLAIAIGLLATWALVLGFRRFRASSLPETARQLVESGMLFALALAGIVVLTVLAFSLQINEDTRYLLTVIPMIGVLVAWSLSVLAKQALTGFAAVLLAGNLMVSHAYAHGFDPFRLTVFNYLQKASLNADNKTLLTKMVRSTCDRGLGDRQNLIIVNYATLNGNNANFYSMKDGFSKGYYCHYSNLVFVESDPQVGLRKIESSDPPYVISVAPDKQDKADFFNKIARPTTEFLAKNPDFEFASGTDDYLLIFRKTK